MTVVRSPWEIAADLIDPVPDPYLADPVAWVNDVLGEYLWSKQREILEKVRDHRRVAVKSSHGPGKSRVASRAIAWWLSVHPPGTARAATSAPSKDQVRGVLWNEINDAHLKADLPGEVNQTEWWIGKFQAGIGRKPADPAKGGTDQTVDAFQGFHAPHMLVVFDEANGMPLPLWAAAKSLTTGEHGRFLAIGNPDDPDSEFARICKPGSGWEVVSISTFDTPNFTGEWVPPELAAVLPSEVWLQEYIDDYGEDSPVYVSKVLGEFPESASDGVIRWRSVSACQLVEPDETGPVDLGLDVGASNGGDATVIRERRGNKPGREWVLRSDDSEKIVGLAIQAIHETGASRIKIDAIGVGWGVAGHLNAQRKEGIHSCKVFKVNVSERSTQPKRFPNLRSQLWWEVGRESTENGLWALGGLDDTTLGELLAPRYRIDAKGLNVVEKKSETKARLRRSPDHADALLLAFYEPAGGGPGKSYGRQVAAARIG